MDLFKKCFDQTRFAEMKQAGLYPFFHQITGMQQTTVQLEGKEVIMLGSNNYLGLTSHPDVIKAAVDATEKYGTGVSGSRFLNGTLDLHVTLEKELAEYLDKEHAIVFSTGFQSNLAIISSLVGRHDYVISDKENHASIYDACRLSWGKMLRYEHSDMEDLERQLKSVPKDAGILIVTDGVFSMTGEVANLPEIVRIGKKYGARIMVDDAHGFGVLGKGGRGTADHFGLTDEVDVIMGTFSKSLASIGGYVVVNGEPVAEYIRHNSRPFIFSAAIPAACAASALEALRVLKREPELVDRVNEMAELMRTKLLENNIKMFAHDFPVMPVNSPIIPIIIEGDDILTCAVCKELLAEGVYVNPVGPPATPPGVCLLRTSYTSLHTKEIIEKAANIIVNVMKKMGLCK